jgi:hypothetical protein
MAHYDPDGDLAPHARRNAEALLAACDRVLLVTTATLTAAARAAVPAGVELIERDNEGYDFYSWKVGIASLDLGALDQLITCNDSYVGPLVPYGRILGAMARVPVDFWGITRTDRRAPHVQSYFVSYRRWVLHSAAFRRFWTSMVPISDRLEVIKRYEIGLSGGLLAAGFGMGAYFVENEADRRQARLRHWWWAANAVRNQPPDRRLAAARRMPFEFWNPMAALADRALHGARLPVVKLDTLRYDPYRLGADTLLAECEREYPDAFAGVRELLERTAPRYAARGGGAGASDRPSPALVRATLGY